MDDGLAQINTQLGVLTNDMSWMKEEMKRSGKNTAIELSKIDEKLDHNYVTQDQFAPIQKLVYLVATLVITGVVGALLAVIIK